MTAVLEPETDAPTVEYAHRKFSEQCRVLAEPRIRWNGSAVESDPPLYALVRDSVSAAGMRMGASSFKSKPPCRVDALDFLARFDAEVFGWCVEVADWRPDSVVAALLALAEATYCPDDVPALLDRTKALHRYVVEAESLTGLAPVSVPLRGSRCPRCESAISYRRSGSEQLRQPSLWVSEHGAQCHSCGARWVTESELSVFRRCVGLESLV